MTLKKNGFAHISTLLTSSEIYKIEKSLINLITNLSKKENKNFHIKSKKIINFQSKKFKKESLKLLEEIELKDNKFFYEISKECGRLIIFSEIDTKIKKILISFFNKKDYLIAKKFPIMLFNKKNLERLKYEWHQELSFNDLSKFGLHLWFPLFRSVKKDGDGGMLFALKSHRAVYDYKKIKKTGSWTQKIPNVNVEKKFKIKSVGAKLGEAILFVDKLLHKSDIQKNMIPRTSIVIRYLGEK